MYLSSKYFDSLHKSQTFELFRASDLFHTIEKEAESHLTNFWHERLTAGAKDVLAELKKSDVYPYHEAPKTGVEKAERKLFDIVATKVISESPKYLGESKKTKSLVLNLLKQALEKDPKTIITVLEETLKLPQEELQDWSKLIQRYSLSDLIKMSRTVSDRMVFLKELQHLIYDDELKKEVLERRHLHKIVEKELWLFGDEYLLGTSDKTLEDVLKKHINVLGRSELVPKGSVSSKRPDLFLYKRFNRKKSVYEHLIIELKRPDLILGKIELDQIKEYASLVSIDPRFDKKNTTWKFVLIGNDYDNYVRTEITQGGRPDGVAFEPKGSNYSVHVMTWGEILQDQEGKYEYLKSRLAECKENPEDLIYVREKFGNLFEPESAVHLKVEKIV